MNQEQFQHTRALFDAAFQRPPRERQAFLEQACGSDPRLRERVERLLQYAETEAGGASWPEPPGASSPEDVATVGALAPDFDLPTLSAGRIRGRAALRDFRGRWLVLVFYPHDFSLICPTELTAFSNRIEEFRDVGAEILGMSVDSLDSHERWVTTSRAGGGLGGLNFDLASDGDGAVSRSYGVYLEQQRVASRGLFVIDPNGVLQFKAVHNLSVGRRTDDVLRVVSALQTGGLCAEDWTPGLATIDPTLELKAGSVVSHYRVEECVGSGSFAFVFRAQDMTLERTVALKVIKPDGPLPVSSVLTEARAAAALNHTNICTVFGVDDTEGIPFIAMEYVQGRPLSELVDQEKLSVERVADIGRQIALGMAAAHALGISHGDLKPANVVVREDGVVKILDFGLARLGEHALDPDATASRGGLRGTPAYMSPEQASGGRATPGSDVFSLGVILYKMLTGQDAFGGPGIPKILEQIRAVDPDQLAADVPEPFADVLRRALVREARDRNLTMDEIAESLGRRDT